MNNHQLAEEIRADAIHNRGATGDLRDHILTESDERILELFFGCPRCETIDDGAIDSTVDKVQSLDEFLEITQLYRDAHRPFCRGKRSS